jgi:hypothetical protein
MGYEMKGNSVRPQLMSRFRQPCWRFGRGTIGAPCAQAGLGFINYHPVMIDNNYLTYLGRWSTQSGCLEYY